MLTSVLLAGVLVMLTFWLHYRILALLNAVLGARSGADRSAAVLLVVLALFCAHMVEIGIYAAAYYLAETRLDLGAFLGHPPESAMTYLYYSGVVYTSLGFGDIHPSGHLRFITQIEALNGLMLITWSASFTYLEMKKVW